MFPICTGYYFYKGEHNGFPYYARDDDAWYIYAEVDGVSWYISPILGQTEPPRFKKPSPGIVGSYLATFPYTGAANVAEYVP